MLAVQCCSTDSTDVGLKYAQHITAGRQANHWWVNYYHCCGRKYNPRLCFDANTYRRLFSRPLIDIPRNTMSTKGNNEYSLVRTCDMAGLGRQSVQKRYTVLVLIS